MSVCCLCVNRAFHCVKEGGGESVRVREGGREERGREGEGGREEGRGVLW